MNYEQGQEKHTQHKELFLTAVSFSIVSNSSLGISPRVRSSGLVKPRDKPQGRMYYFSRRSVPINTNLNVSCEITVHFIRHV